MTFRQCGWTLSKDDQVIARESYWSVFFDVIGLNQQSSSTFLFFSVHSLVRFPHKLRSKRCSLSYVYVLKSFSDIFLLLFFLLLLEVFFPKLVKQLSKVSPWSCKFC